jgi:type VI secretion system protein ImpA
MPATDLQQDSTASGESLIRVIDSAVLTPVPGPKPAGEDIRAVKLWVDLRTARPKMEDATADHDWALANPVVTDWSSYRDMVEQALIARSKDLELGIFLTEASARVFGFAGVRDGLWTLGGLITNFIQQGLFPEPDEGDLEAQYGKLDWLNEKLSDVIREIPLTKRPEPGINYSLNYRDESRRTNGMITAADFEEAALAGSAEDYDALLATIQEARSELTNFSRIFAEHYGSGKLSFGMTEETLDECRTTIQGILRKVRPITDVPNIGEPGSPGDSLPTPNGTAVTGSDAWSECERLARSGNVDRALAGMAALAASEPNGRIRFQRKLLLADLCLKTNRKKLATSILQELNEIIELHKLESWETSEIVGGVWSRLVRCYRDRSAGTADEGREAEFFLKLSRLDPWQALACGEPAKKE